MRLVDWQISSLHKRHHVLDPYEPMLVRETPDGPSIAYGLARDSYVLRLSTTAAAITYSGATVDPKRPPRATDVSGLRWIPAQSCLMALSMEHVQIPRGYVARAELVQEYAMCGVQLVVPELIGGHDGRVLLSLVNPLMVPIWVYHGEGVARLVIEDAPLPSREEDQMEHSRSRSAGAGLRLPEGQHAD